MANPHKIGLFISNDKVIVVESDRDIIQKFVTLPIITSALPSKEDTNYSEINEEIQIVSLFQKILRENKITPGQVCVSIPTKELFLRSFVIPVMPSGEVNNVVFFEAKKYVPFDLKLLDYAFKAIPFVENKEKRLRIIFYGVRKQTLEKYDRILKQLECTPFVYEPALVSLSKQLIDKKHLRLDQKMVVVYVHKDHGQIVFYEKGISYFFRDFPLSVDDIHDPKAAPDVVRLQLIREIRKSFEYYSRQFSKEKIKEILVLSTVLDKELIDSFAEELGVKAKVIESLVTVDQQSFTDMDAISVCGSCVTNKAISFNFLDFKLSAQMKDATSFLPAYVTEFLVWDLSELIQGIQAFIICALIIGGGYFASYLILENLKKQNNVLIQRQGDMASVSAEYIKIQKDSNESRLNAYRQTMASSKISYLIVTITKALPEGVWLNSIKIRYNNVNQVYIDLDGTVYLEDQKAEFKSVNEFLSRMKKTPLLVNIKFNINRMDKQQSGKFGTVVFSISGA